MCFLARIMAALQVASWDTLVCVMNLFWEPETNTDMQLYTSVSANKNCFVKTTNSMNTYFPRKQNFTLNKIKTITVKNKDKKLTIHVMKEYRCQRIK